MLNIWVQGNYFFLQDTVTGKIHEAHAKDVKITKNEPESTSFYIRNVGGWEKGNIPIPFTDIKKEGGVAWTDQAEFETFYIDETGKFSPQAGGIIDGIQVERLIDGQSVAISQNPTGLGIANAIQVEYGVSIGTISDDVMLSNTGTLTFNKAGTYRIKIALQFGRLGNPSASIILFRVVDDNNVQLGRSIGYMISSSDETSYLENDTWLTVPAGYVVKTEVMRDSNGIDSGGLVSVDPVDEGVNTWNRVPTSAIRVEKFVGS